MAINDLDLMSSNLLGAQQAAVSDQFEAALRQQSRGIFGGQTACGNLGNIFTTTAGTTGIIVDTTTSNEVYIGRQGLPLPGITTKRVSDDIDDQSLISYLQRKTDGWLSGIELNIG